MGNTFGQGIRDGVDLSQFGSIEVPESLQCSLCWKLFHEPVTTRCGHTFCKPCLQSWTLKQPICPIDRNPITRRSLTPNKAISDICVSLFEALNSESLVKISHTASGVADKGSLSEVDVNLDELSIEKWDSILSDSVLKNAICPMHSGLVVEPILTGSGTSCCRSCLDKKADKTIFSISWGRPSPDEYIQNRSLEELIQGTKLGCFHSLKKCEKSNKLTLDEDGCPHRMLVHERNQHESNCTYAYISCTVDGCREKLRKRDYEHHLTLNHQTPKEKHDALSPSASISRIYNQIYSTYRGQSTKQSSTDASKSDSPNTSLADSTTDSEDNHHHNHQTTQNPNTTEQTQTEATA